MSQLSNKGFMYFNRLREFYDGSDRLKILEYIINYTVEELIWCGLDPKDKKAFDERVRIRGYMVVKKLYEVNIKRLYAGKDVLPLRFPDKEDIRKRIKNKYSDLEEKIKDYEEEGKNWEDDTEESKE